MIHVYDLYDLYAVFVRIRFSQYSEANKAVMSGVISVLKNRNFNNELNQFRRAISMAVSEEENDLYDFAFVENEYTYFPLTALKDERIYAVLDKACKRLYEAICDKDNEKIYDLADCLHNLPIIIAENKYAIPVSYWEGEVKAYRNKWDKDFLVDEEQMFK